jgi:hypothetical protein
MPMTSAEFLISQRPRSARPGLPPGVQPQKGAISQFLNNVPRRSLVAELGRNLGIYEKT